MVSPCKNCDSSTGRYPGCHDHCEKPEYLEWRKQLEAVKLARRTESEVNNTKINIIYRTKKRVGK